jgi:CheY-like chemotaxis protein
VFDEFYRVGDAAGQPGLGLGLSIVRRLAERLDCRVEIAYTDAETQTGTTVTVYVPRAQQAAAPTGPTRAGDVAGEEDVAGLAVLVIDDDELVLDATRKLLAQWQCRVATCRHPDGLDAALDGFGAPDVALVDYQLGGGIDGLDVLARVRARYPEMGVVVVSAYGAARKDQDPLAESGLPVLEKPVSPRELRLTLSLFKAAAE